MRAVVAVERPIHWVENASVITLVLTQAEARTIVDLDWDKSREPSSAGKVLYSALMQVANPSEALPTEL